MPQAGTKQCLKIVGGRSQKQKCPPYRPYLGCGNRKEIIRENSVIHIFGTPNVFVIGLFNVPLALVVVVDFWAIILVHRDTSVQHQDLVRSHRYDNLDTCKRDGLLSRVTFFYDNIDTP